MSDFHAATEAAQRSDERTQQRPSRKPPKPAEQLLAEAEKRMGVLRAKVLANRDRQRAAFIEDLYKKYDVGPVVDDASESKRLASLRIKLGL